MYLDSRPHAGIGVARYHCRAARTLIRVGRTAAHVSVIQRSGVLRCAVSSEEQCNNDYDHHDVLWHVLQT